MTTVAQDQETSVALVQAYFNAYEQKDQQGVSGLLADDVVYETVFSATGGLEPFYHFQGRDATMGHITTVMGNNASIAFIDMRWSPAADPDVVFLEAQGNLVSAKGAPYQNRYVFKFTLGDGRIRGISEYANPVTFAKLNGVKLG